MRPGSPDAMAAAGEPLLDDDRKVAAEQAARATERHQDVEAFIHQMQDEAFLTQMLTDPAFLQEQLSKPFLQETMSGIPRRGAKPSLVVDAIVQVLEQYSSDLRRDIDAPFNDAQRAFYETQAAVRTRKHLIDEYGDLTGLTKAQKQTEVILAERAKAGGEGKTSSSDLTPVDRYLNQLREKPLVAAWIGDRSLAVDSLTPKQFVKAVVKRARQEVKGFEKELKPLKEEYERLRLARLQSEVHTLLKGGDIDVRAVLAFMESYDGKWAMGKDRDMFERIMAHPQMDTALKAGERIQADKDEAERIRNIPQTEFAEELKTMWDQWNQAKIFTMMSAATTVMGAYIAASVKRDDPEDLNTTWMTGLLGVITLTAMAWGAYCQFKNVKQKGRVIYDRNDVYVATASGFNHDTLTPKTDDDGSYNRPNKYKATASADDVGDVMVARMEAGGGSRHVEVSRNEQAWALSRQGMGAQVGATAGAVFSGLTAIAAAIIIDYPNRTEKSIGAMQYGAMAFSLVAFFGGSQLLKAWQRLPQKPISHDGSEQEVVADELQTANDEWARAKTFVYSATAVVALSVYDAFTVRRDDPEDVDTTILSAGLGLISLVALAWGAHHQFNNAQENAELVIKRASAARQSPAPAASPRGAAVPAMAEAESKHAAGADDAPQPMRDKVFITQDNYHWVGKRMSTAKQVRAVGLSVALGLLTMAGICAMADFVTQGDTRAGVAQMSAIGLSMFTAILVPWSLQRFERLPDGLAGRVNYPSEGVSGKLMLSVGSVRNPSDIFGAPSEAMRRQVAAIEDARARAEAEARLKAADDAGAASGPPLLQ